MNQKGYLIVTCLVSERRISQGIPETLLAELTSLAGPISKIYRADGHELLPRSYRVESGCDLTCIIMEFRELSGWGDLCKVKAVTSEIEKNYSPNNKRIYNLNPGLLMPNGFWMASHKPAKNRELIGTGVWAEPQLTVMSGKLTKVPWTFEEIRCTNVFRSIEARFKRFKRKKKLTAGVKALV